ncbi:2-phosphosulfolactate phosphatase [Psychromicrobium sp. YIM B11713]|uniref:2-phosphosulfolactate phosphatase n=1 Tax=Psychromicrobium sp. YIM B11713 TaxID=3145233 RepID=UPI00374F3D57
MQIDFAWGLSGALAICEPHSIAVVHDILSFSTTVEIAVQRGIEVLPYPSRSAGAADYAKQQRASLAGSRQQRESLTLSPSSIAGAAEPLPARLVLPSPNGATISAALADRGTEVFAACLRNSLATAEYLVGLNSPRVVSIAAGEYWPDGTYRPAIEDLIGAARLISALSSSRGSALTLSDAARLSLASLQAVEEEIPAVIQRSPSGQELIERGFMDDVELACQLDVSNVVTHYRPSSSSFTAV